MNSGKFLSLTLALVLIAGFAHPSFAQQVEIKTLQTTSTQTITISSADPDDIIFENGPVDTTSAVLCGGSCFIADDFEVTQNLLLTDVHLLLLDVFDTDSESVEYRIYADDSGLPGEVIASGNAINLEGVEDVFFEIWFDLEEPVNLEANTTYWIGLDLPDVFWFGSGFVYGQLPVAIPDGGPPGIFWDLGVNFILTGHPPEIVGGEFLPTDTTALLLAAASSPFTWLSSIAFVVVGVGAFLVLRNPYNMRNIKTILEDYFDRD